jgi:hypothetical protein
VTFGADSCSAPCWVSPRLHFPKTRARSRGGEMLAGLDPTSYEASLVKLRAAGHSSSVTSLDPPGARGGGILRGTVVPRCGRRLCRTPCRPPPIRAGVRRRTPHSAFAMTSASSTAEDAPSTGTAPACAGLPRLGLGAFTRGTACATHTLPHSSFLGSFFCSTPRSILPSRPRIVARAARRPGQGGPAFGPPAGLGLDAVEHGARLKASGVSGIVMRPSS